MDRSELTHIERLERLERLQVPVINAYPEEREANGCVVRSLQSIADAEATEVEWEMRLSLVRRTRSSEELFTEVDGDMVAFQAAMFRNFVSDLGDIEGYIRKLATRDTPLGRSLRAFEVAAAHRRPLDVVHEVRQGNKVMLTVMEDTKWHAAHVTPNPDGALVQLSDGGQSWPLDPDRHYDAFIFKPRG